ncbi:protein-glutamate O-methyltransferase CheR [Malonomonas rubra]|uniref:CheR family methyltransferase n=1 Tax=Malonomonas rubra TaxID=57040 RepID=UPI0026EEF215|nr:protein-glutamate O-methyltransferase CheR [Malonomonas rubra]
MAVSIDVHEVVLTISPDEQNLGGKLLFGHEVPFVGSDISEVEYWQIGEILRQQQNFSLSGYKDLCIKRRIATRIRTLGMSNPAAYVTHLAAEVSEQEQLLKALSVHVSHFFRNPSTYKVLEKKILPELLEQSLRQRNKLRIWSVGCSDGEEPYSIALLGQKLSIEAGLLKIIGTDLSSEALSRAKRGSYEQSRLHEVPESLLQKYFEHIDNRYSLTASIRNSVQFFRHDILSDQPFYRADLILCRNVLIYFSREQQQRVLQILTAALSAGGYLVLGRAENLVASCRELFQCIDPAERIYQRLEEGEQLLPTVVVGKSQDFS